MKIIIFAFSFMVGFIQHSLCQKIIQDPSLYRTISLEELINYNPNMGFNILESYNIEKFNNLSSELEQFYFDKVKNVLNKSDSISISDNFKKLPISLSKQYKKETKILIKKMNRLNIKLSNDSDYVIEPRYFIEIERSNPIAYMIGMEYILIDKVQNMIYNIKI